MTGEENPLYECYAEIHEISREYDTIISLEDTCRPSCYADRSDV